MKRTLSTFCTYLILLVLLVSCHDDQVAPQPRYRLKAVQNFFDGSNSTVADTTIESYTYDQQGKLSTYSFLSPVSPKRTTTLFYDSQDRLVKKETTIAYDSQAIASPYFSASTHLERTTYDYDSNGNRIVAKKYSSMNASPSYFTLDEENTFAYTGSAKLPTKITTKINTGWQFDPTYHFSQEFTYTDGNITTIKYTNMPTRLNQYKLSTSLQNFQYDTKPNPYFGIDQTTSDRALFTYSKNNPILSDVTYTYDQRGLLISSNEANGLHIRNYEYESY